MKNSPSTPSIFEGRSEGFRDNTMRCLPWLENDSQAPGFILNDITLRDGKQALAWWNLWTKEEAVTLVDLFAEMGIHHAEIGFPAIPNDPETRGVRRIAEAVGQRDIAMIGLARAVRSDIETAIEALSPAKYAGVHTFIGTSPEHLEARRFTHEQVKEKVRDRVSQITDAGLIAEFSCEDATRTEESFMIDVYGEAVGSGAHILNVPDTVGYVDPDDYAGIVEKVHRVFPDQIISTHTHNDMGQAEMNGLVALKRGIAQRFEGTIFGIGERAGNADWTSMIMGILSQKDNPKYAHLAHKLIKNPKKMGELLKYFEKISGLHQRPVSPGHGYESQMNRSGVHQDGVKKMKEAYIWMDTDEVGLEERPMFDITPLSGKAGVSEKLLSLGVEMDENTKLGITTFYRNLFSGDIDKTALTKEHGLSETDADRLIKRIQNIRKEARTHKNNDENIKRWLCETDRILIDSFFMVYPNHKSGHFQLESANFGGHIHNEDTIYKGVITINEKEYIAESDGEVSAVIHALSQAAESHNITYIPGDVKSLVAEKGADSPAEMTAYMVDNETGEKIELFVRDQSTANTHIKAFMQGANRILNMRKYRKRNQSN